MKKLLLLALAACIALCSCSDDPDKPGIFGKKQLELFPELFKGEWYSSLGATGNLNGMPIYSSDLYKIDSVIHIVRAATNDSLVFRNSIHIEWISDSSFSEVGQSRIYNKIHQVTSDTLVMDVFIDGRQFLDNFDRIP